LPGFAGVDAQRSMESADGDLGVGMDMPRQQQRSRYGRQ